MDKVNFVEDSLLKIYLVRSWITCLILWSALHISDFPVQSNSIVAHIKKCTDILQSMPMLRNV